MCMYDNSERLTKNLPCRSIRIYIYKKVDFD